MISNKRVCIFVDGENLRHSIADLFDSFDNRDYLPKGAEWSRLFDWIATEAAGPDADRVRTYWYTVQNIDFSPFGLNSARKDKNESHLLKLLSRDQSFADTINNASVGNRSSVMQKMAETLLIGQDTMEKRFAGWIHLQDMIAREHRAIEFRRAGAIRYDLFRRTLGNEKSVDVKLATDLIRLKDIYDIAVIVSGDQDYVPAVDAIKDFGKRTVNVAFLKEDGLLLPGGAKRLNQSTDWSLTVKHSDLSGYLKFS